SRINSAAVANPFFLTLLEQVRALPGVKSASLSWALPFEDGANVDGYLIDGRAVPPTGNEAQVVQVGVSPGHFATVGIRPLFGRDFTTADDTTSLPVAVID